MNRPFFKILFAVSCLGVTGCGGEGGDRDGANQAAGGADANAAALDWTGLDGGPDAATGNADVAGQPSNAPAVAGGAPPQVGDIVIENGVRYRAGPSDARVRVDDNGAEITVETPDPDMPAADGEG